MMIRYLCLLVCCEIGLCATSSLLGDSDDDARRDQQRYEQRQQEIREDQERYDQQKEQTRRSEAQYRRRQAENLWPSTQ